MPNWPKGIQYKTLILDVGVQVHQELSRIPKTARVYMALKDITPSFDINFIQMQLEAIDVIKVQHSSFRSKDINRHNFSVA